MSDILLRQIALVSESDTVDKSEVAKVSAALSKQATRDLVQFWDVKATVDTFPKLEDVPVGYWPIIIRDDIKTEGASGVHEDKNGQPFALVTASHQLDEWSLSASHELIEMLIDPFGKRLVAADSPKADQGRVEILVEACDPSEASEFAYTINGILVSDFYSPRFFDPVAIQGVRYSFTGAIHEPRQVLRGGYLSWHDVASDMWWQETWFDGESPTFKSLGRLNAQHGSFRSQVDRLTSPPPRTPVVAGMRASKVAGLPVASTDRAAATRAATLRRQIDSLIGGRTDDPGEADTADLAARSSEASAAPHQRGSRANGMRNGSGAVPGLRRTPSF